MSVLNPVIGREVTERLRSLRAFLVITVFVLVLAGAMYLVVEAVGTFDVLDVTSATPTGRIVFETTVLIMAILVAFFVPGLTAGAIAGERERQTLSTLQVTMLRNRSILTGKIVSAVLFLVLLVLASLPVLAVAYALGGIRVSDVIRGSLAVVLWAVLLAVMVVSVSSFARRVQTATILAYGFTVLICLIGPLLYFIGWVLDRRSAEPNEGVAAPAWLLAANPVSIVADLGAGNRTANDGPLSSIRKLLGEAKADNAGRWFAWFPRRPDQADLDDVRVLGHPIGGMPAWLLGTLILGAIALVLFLLALRRLRTPSEVER